MPSGSGYQKWTDEQLALIEQVKRHPTLYMKNENNYMPIDQVWNNIAKELGTTVDYCRRRWKTIRDNYVKRKKLLNENYVVYSSKYLDTDTLSFLELRTTSANKWSSVLEPLQINEKTKDKDKPKTVNTKENESSIVDREIEELRNSLQTIPAINLDKGKVDKKIPANKNKNINTGKTKKRTNISKPSGNLQDNKNDQNTQQTLNASKQISTDSIQKDIYLLNTSNENTVHNFQENKKCINVESSHKIKSRKRSSKKKSACKTATNINDLSNINKIISSTESELPPDILDSILNTTDEDLNANNHYDLETVVNCDNMTNASTTATLITQDIIDSVLTNNEREPDESTEYLHTVVSLDTNSIESSFINTDAPGVTFNGSAPIDQYTLIIPEGDTVIPVGEGYSDPISLNINDEMIQTLQPPATVATEESEDPLTCTTVPSTELNVIDKDDSTKKKSVENTIVPEKKVDFTLISDELKNNIFNVYDINSENSDIKMFFNAIAEYVSLNLSLKKQMELRLHICSMLTKAELGEVERRERTEYAKESK